MIAYRFDGANSVPKRTLSLLDRGPMQGNAKPNGNAIWIQRRLLNRSASKRTRMLSRMVKAIMLLPP